MKRRIRYKEGRDRLHYLQKVVLAVGRVLQIETGERDVQHEGAVCDQHPGTAQPVLINVPAYREFEMSHGITWNTAACLSRGFASGAGVRRRAIAGRRAVRNRADAVVLARIRGARVDFHVARCPYDNRWDISLIVNQRWLIESVCPPVYPGSHVQE